MRTPKQRANTAALARAWRANNPEKNRAIKKRWRESHPESVRAAHKRRYEKYGEEMKARVSYEYHNNINGRKDKTKQRLKDSRLKLWRMKSKTGCANCGERDPRLLDYHHENPSTKLFGIAVAYNGSASKIAEEAEKCIVLCANCHRKVTLVRLEALATQVMSEML